ncbi:MAG: GAF domain-containing sensor histidine kinase [Anaerolineae bacterium]|nr:GAF domain-containing sensor histidine kinase [Anaerolineae bacterium]
MAERLEEQLEELMMLQRVDQELNSTLNLESVMMLTIDWAMRRTGAAAGMVCISTQDNAGLIPLVTLGYDPDRMIYTAENPFPLTLGVTGRCGRTRKLQVVQDITTDPDYFTTVDNMRWMIAAPIEMRGRLLGVISLEGDQDGELNDANVKFVKRLASRSAIALENARLYQETERRANEMSALYAASRIISSSIERIDVIKNSSQAVADVLSVSSTIFGEYREDLNRLTMVASTKFIPSSHAPDLLPAANELLELNAIPELANSIKQNRILALSINDPNLSEGIQQFMDDHFLKSMLLLPLAVQDQKLGLLMAVDGRRERRFMRDEILLAESLASQIAAAMRQAKLYEDVRELESLKSEMIRMASHDLRNPLGNVMGYLELLVSEISYTFDQNHQDYVKQMRTSLNTIKSLIEDLLTLDKIESERQESFTRINLSTLLDDVFMSQQFQAIRNNQTMNLAKPIEAIYVQASSTQLRQALVNLINNAIKYTPENGLIQVRLTFDDNRVRFEVQDTGYGISKEKQSRLFSRFYRAREQHTEHIMGTGLGLSLVKTVVERHGGEVWVKSALGKGSTFGFWLPAKRD